MHFYLFLYWFRFVVKLLKNASQITSARSQPDIAKLAAMVLKCCHLAGCRNITTVRFGTGAAHAATSRFLHRMWSAMAHQNHEFSGSMFWSRKRPSFWTPGVQNGTRIGTRNQAHETKVFSNKKKKNVRRKLQHDQHKLC